MAEYGIPMTLWVEAESEDEARALATGETGGRGGVELMFAEQVYVAWVGKRNADGSFDVEKGDMHYTVSLDEAKAWRVEDELPIGSTLGVTEPDGHTAILTHTPDGYVVEELR